MKDVDEQEVEDDSDYDMGGDDDTLINQEEQPGRLVNARRHRRMDLVVGPLGVQRMKRPSWS